MDVGGAAASGVGTGVAGVEDAGGIATAAGSLAVGAGLEAGFGSVTAAGAGTGFDSVEAGSSATTGLVMVAFAIAGFGWVAGRATGVTSGSGSSGTISLRTTTGCGLGCAAVATISLSADCGGCGSTGLETVFTVSQDANARHPTISRT